jgi:hypothetical protein
VLLQRSIALLPVNAFFDLFLSNSWVDDVFTLVICEFDVIKGEWTCYSHFDVILDLINEGQLSQLYLEDLF